MAEQDGTQPALIKVAAAFAAALGIEEVEQIVLQLVEDADRVEGERQAARLVGAKTRKMRSASHWECEQGAGLSGDGPKVRSPPFVGRGGQGQLSDLAANGALGVFRENLHQCSLRLGSVFAKRTKRQHQEKVARIDRLRDAVPGPKRRLATPRLVTVLDVVVHERRIVQQLDGRGPGDRVLGPTAQRVACRQGQPCTQALAAVAQVLVNHACTGIGEAVAGELGHSGLDLDDETCVRKGREGSQGRERGSRGGSGCVHGLPDCKKERASGAAPAQRPVRTKCHWTGTGKPKKSRVMAEPSSAGPSVAPR